MPKPRVYEPRVSTNIKLSPELNERLKAAAAERTLSVNFLMVRAIEDFLDRLLPLDEIKWTRDNVTKQAFTQCANLYTFFDNSDSAVRTRTVCCALGHNHPGDHSDGLYQWPRDLKRCQSETTGIVNDDENRPFFCVLEEGHKSHHTNGSFDWEDLPLGGVVYKEQDPVKIKDWFKDGEGPGVRYVVSEYKGTPQPDLVQEILRNQRKEKS